MTMARKKVRGLDEALDEIFSDYEKALTVAMNYASDKAKKEIKDEAESCLDRYYYNYDPSQYERTEQLKNAFIPYKKVSRVRNEIVADVGMGYWPFMLDGLYTDGSKQWHPVDGWWILDNYLKGIHPRTDGSEFVGAPYIPVTDHESPEDHMKLYLEQYVNTFNNDILKSFADQIARG